MGSGLSAWGLFRLAQSEFFAFRTIARAKLPILDLLLVILDQVFRVGEAFSEACSADPSGSLFRVQAGLWKSGKKPTSHFPTAPTTTTTTMCIFLFETKNRISDGFCHPPLRHSAMGLRSKSASTIFLRMIADLDRWGTWEISTEVVRNLAIQIPGLPSGKLQTGDLGQVWPERSLIFH